MSLCQNQKDRRGFLLTELLIALAVFLLILPGLLQIQLYLDVTKYIHTLLNQNSKNILPFDIMTSSDGSVPQNVYSQFNDKNCDIAYADIALSRPDFSVSHVQYSITNDLLSMPTSTQNQFTNLKYIGKTPYGTHTIIVGANSASTTEPDLFVFDYDMRRGLILLKDYWYLGPGVFDMDVFRSNNTTRSYSDQVFLIEKSVVSPLWKLNTSVFPWTVQNIPISSVIKGVYPQVVKSNDKYVVIGLEKNQAEELIVFDRNKINTSISDSVVTRYEVGATINDVAILDSNRIFFVTSQNPELQSVVIGSTTRIDSSNNTDNLYDFIHNFDAPGELGNGKVIAPYPYGMFLGRTVGNQELYSLKQKLSKDVFTKAGTQGIQINQNMSQNTNQFLDTGIDINTSVKKIVAAHEGAGIILLTNSNIGGLRILNQNSAAHLQEYFKDNLSSKGNDIDCVGNRIVVITQSTTTPFEVWFKDR